MRVGSQNHAPAALPPGKDPVPIVKEAGWTPGWSGWVRKISPPPEFDPRTVIAYFQWLRTNSTWFVTFSTPISRKNVRQQNHTSLREQIVFLYPHILRRCIGCSVGEYLCEKICVRETDSNKRRTSCK